MTEREKLNKGIIKHRAQIRTDGYPISIGELLAMYKAGELDIHPEFQRFFRWSLEQKSRLIESLLLGIPLPSIFVSQREDGVFDVIDGLQRLSTIFQFCGELVSEDSKKIEPLVLTKTKYLPSLEGMKWGSEEDGPFAIGINNQLLIKRSKVDVKIILRESSEQSKYELFQRLNSGGSQLEDQELRNCLIVMTKPEYYRWMTELRDFPDFQRCLTLSDKNVDEQYDLELVTRFLILHKVAEGELKKIQDVGPFLDDQIVLAAATFNTKTAKNLKHTFEDTFRLIAQSLGEDAFKRFDANKDKFLGGFLISAFEYIALGVGWSVMQGKKPSVQSLQEKAKAIWSDDTFKTRTGSGVRASQRIPYVVPMGRRDFFDNCNEQ